MQEAGMKTKRFLSRSLFATGYLFLAVSLTLASCNMPAIPFLNLATPTATPQPLPPALVESLPPEGSQVTLQEKITLFFNQPMHRDSLEAALESQPAFEKALTWVDDSTLLLAPLLPLSPNTDFTISIETSARAANGLNLPEPVTLSFRTADYLRPALFLPAPEASEVWPNSAISVTFNQPVVSLGADPASLTEALTFQPPAAGRGEWLNTSTYIFYPEPGLTGGVTYAASLYPGLTGTAGSPLAPESRASWTFTTAMPRLVAVEPSTETPFPLDPKIKLTFNQPMDTASLEANLALVGPAGPEPGTFSWNEDRTIVTFEPQSLLARGADYALVLGAQARGQGGTALGEEMRITVRSFANFSVRGASLASSNVAEVNFSTPPQESDIEALVKISPPVPVYSAYVDNWDVSLRVFANFEADTEYTLSLPASLKDRWGMRLGEPFTYTFRTPPAQPNLQVTTFGDNLLLVRPDKPVLSANAANVTTAQTVTAAISLEEFFWYENTDYQSRQTYTPANAATIQQNFALTPNRSQPVELALTRNDSLPAGLYYARTTWNNDEKDVDTAQIAAVSRIDLTLKAGGADALVWAADMAGLPISGLPVTLYTSQGAMLASGTTDASGLWYTAYSGSAPPAYAVSGQPGDENFGFASLAWDHGVSAWNFGHWSYLQPEKDSVYLYTDRPIYRPGQTVYFRGVLRKAFNGRYSLPDNSRIRLSLASDYPFVELAAFDLPLSTYGTFHGEYRLPEDAAPGYYSLRNPDLDVYLDIQVAEYRKPEIELKVGFSPETARGGQSVQAQVQARYYFDAPATSVPLKWYVYARQDYFSLPGYQTGVFDESWLEAFGDWSMPFGGLISEGEGVTDAAGQMTISLDTLPEADSLQRLTLEVVAKDESNFSLSGRTDLLLHPDDLYIGLRADQYIGQSGAPLGFDVLTVDWNKQPSASHALQAKFQQVTWQRSETKTGFYGQPLYERVYTPVSSSDLVTGPDGKARLAFTPKTAGAYILQVSGGKARSELLLWVGGAGQAAWPRLDNQRLHLTTDQDSYRPGQTAQVFIPNTLGAPARALVTVERGKILSAQVITLETGGKAFSLPLTDEHAPNVFVSVTLMGAAANDFRQGLVQLEVEPEAQSLNVQVTSEPQRAGPRDPVTFDILVSDSKGRPVQGEFSLSVVDLAVLALADPNAEDILPFYYKPQPLGIQTGLSPAAYSGREALFPQGGMGGGGDGGGIPSVREKFPDTAYWQADILTGADGRARVETTLPDSLTTWQVDVRGLTRDTRVGQAQTQLVTTKDLLIRPLTPRFLVSGDHIEMAAIVHNNTSQELDVEVRLQAAGFELDKPKDAAQRVSIPAGGRSKVSWWGTATEAETADLLFSVETRSRPALNDAARPVWGALPILRYTSPQTFVTAGVMPEAGTRQEIISLPRSYTPSSGSLDVELNPSLAGLILTSLDALDLPCTVCGTEHILSYFLPNLEAQHALQAAGIDSPELKARLDENLDQSIRRILARQNEDGGWPWWDDGQSDPYISAYTIFGLLRARTAGATIDEAVIEKARAYLTGAPPDLGGGVPDPWQLDRQAFMQYVLQESGGAETLVVEYLYESRSLLSPWAQALLALTLEAAAPGDPRAAELLSNLQSASLRTASGAHWQSQTNSYQNPGTPLYTTAVVVYALAQQDPANPLLADAVRYLASQRGVSALWGSSYENAWILLALTEVMRGTGELQADFAYSASLNGSPLANRQAGGPQSLAPAKGSASVSALYPRDPNSLAITRQAGAGRLYYRAALNINRPAASAPALKQGLEVSRDFVPFGCKRDCAPLGEVRLGQADKVSARLTLVVPQDAYYVQLEDFIPAGSEVLDPSLKTSQQGIESMDVSQYDPDDPFGSGWGWWYFNKPQVYNNRVLWNANYLPAGTYVLTYTLSLTQAGEYRVLPAHAWLAFFPEVQGASAGAVFSIQP
jgi:hypothetical protein